MYATASGKCTSRYACERQAGWSESAAPSLPNTPREAAQRWFGPGASISASSKAFARLRWKRAYRRGAEIAHGIRGRAMKVDITGPPPGGGGAAETKTPRTAAPGAGGRRDCRQ